MVRPGWWPPPRRWFAGNQIRNVSAVGGNIVTGSPISDLNPLWMASGTLFVAAGKDTGERSVKASEFFLGYRWGQQGGVCGGEGVPGEGVWVAGGGTAAVWGLLA